VCPPALSGGIPINRGGSYAREQQRGNQERCDSIHFLSW
jgi:hypothetical protein